MFYAEIQDDFSNVGARLIPVQKVNSCSKLRQRKQ